MKEIRIATGKSEDDDEGAGEMEEKDDADDAHGDEELDDLIPQSIDDRWMRSDRS